MVENELGKVSLELPCSIIMQVFVKTIECCVSFESEVEMTLKSDGDNYYVPGIPYITMNGVVNGNQ